MGEVIFLGTGTSEGVPRVSCLTADPVTCAVCTSAVHPGSRNRRRNTSVLLRHQLSDGSPRQIVVDVGKFFWHSAIEWFPKYKVPTIDAIVLTHAHADAMGGLDDLRDWTNNRQAAIPIYTRQSDLDVLSQTHFYLVDQARQTGGGGVAKLIFETITEQPFGVEGLTFVPLPVPHGKRMNVFGYRIGGFSYVSDASDVPDSTANLIWGSDVLVLDALRERPHRSHLNFEQAIEFARELRARKTYFVDMTHDVDHDAVNEELAKLRTSDGIDVELAHDGMRIEVDLGEQG